jgi:hypothetical protein
VGAGSRSIALRKCSEMNIVIAGKTPDHGDLSKPVSAQKIDLPPTFVASGNLVSN